MYAALPPTAPVNGVPRPAEPGGSQVVVAKDNGEIALVPSLPPALAIEVFRRHCRATERAAKYETEEGEHQ